MVRPAKSLLTVLLLAGMCLAAAPPSTAASQKTHSTRAKAAKAKTETPPPAPPVPPPPPTPEQLPPNPPQVSFRGGLLTINAQNSTLADILTAVRAQTGAIIDMPAGSGRERVFFQQGPAAARQVLTALLQGSRFDYIIMDSLDRPGDVQHVVLMLKPTGADSTAAAGTPPPASPMIAVPANGDSDLAEGTDDTAPDEPQAQPQPFQPQVTPQPQPFQPAAPQPVEPNSGPQIKTPEQLLEELRLQQQRQQQQQQQQQPQPQPPPQPPDTEPR